MTDRDTADMIQRCIEEIQMLRGRVDALAPKAAAYDTVSQILGLLPQRSQGAAPDIVWELRKELSDLQPKVPVAVADAA